MSYVIRKLHSKTTMKCHGTPNKMAQIQNTDNLKC